MKRFTTRLRQVWDFLTRGPRPEDEAWAFGQLPPELLPLYQEMARYDRYHCTAIARRFATLAPPGWALQAVLLHDCGKGPRFGLVARVLGVLFPAPAIAPHPPRRHPLRRIQQIYQWHGLYGAERAEAAGLAPEACVLIREHHRRPASSEVTWLVQFQAIDDD